jgi:hypothetical protein
MTDDITGYFDGKAIVPDKPLKFKAGQKLKMHIETVDSTERYPLTEIREMAIDMGINNLATDHKHIASPEPGNAD